MSVFSQFGDMVVFFIVQSLSPFSLPSFVSLDELCEIVCFLGHSYEFVFEELPCTWSLRTRQ